MRGHIKSMSTESPHCFFNWSKLNESCAGLAAGQPPDCLTNCASGALAHNRFPASLACPYPGDTRATRSRPMCFTAVPELTSVKCCGSRPPPPKANRRNQSNLIFGCLPCLPLGSMMGYSIITRRRLQWNFHLPLRFFESDVGGPTPTPAFALQDLGNTQA